MRVNETNRANLIQAYKNANQVSASKNRKISMGRDEVNISPEAMELLKQVDDADTIHPARQAKLETLKQQIEAGTYHVPAEQIVEKFLAFWKRV